MTRLAFTLFALACVPLLLSAGCGGTDGGSPTPVVSASPSPSPSPVASDAPLDSRHALTPTLRKIQDQDTLTYDATGTLTRNGQPFPVTSQEFTLHAQPGTVYHLSGINQQQTITLATAPGDGTQERQYVDNRLLRQDSTTGDQKLLYYNFDKGYLVPSFDTASPLLPGTFAVGFSTVWSVPSPSAAEHRETFTVKGTERVTTPYGTFDTYRCERTITDVYTVDSDNTQTRTEWYAPQLGGPVRIDIHREAKNGEVLDVSAKLTQVSFSF